MKSNATVLKLGADAQGAVTRRRMRPRAARPTDVDHASPALVLQSQLAGALAGEVPYEERWSARRTLGMIVVVNGAFWVGVGFVLHAL